MVKLLQEWKLTRLWPTNAHVWEHFIKPADLIAAMRHFNLECQEMRGLASQNGLAMLRKALAIRSGKISGQELTNIMALRETKNLDLSYMGVSIKKTKNVSNNE